MQFSSITAVAMAAILSAAPALACKCLSNGKADTARTESCCTGSFSGGDCAANSISEHLSEFRSCCGGQSDCDFPTKREDDETTTIVVRS